LSASKFSQRGLDKTKSRFFIFENVLALANVNGFRKMAAANPKITLALKNVTLEEATGRIAMAAGVRVSVKDYAFVFDAKSDKP
jgi:hypothetical protein